MSDQDKRRLAIFVEGQTEQLFVARLVREIAGEHRLQIDSRKAIGRQGRRYLCQQYVTPSDPSKRYYLLVVDSSSDESVAADIVEQYDRLSKKGYSRIIGLRDVYGKFKYRDVPKLERGIQRSLATLRPRRVPVDIVLAVMEIEAWFIAEEEHFKQIHPSLTVTAIKKRLGLDPSRDDVERIAHPSRELDRIYRLAGKRYRKKKPIARRTIRSLDYENLYVNVSTRVPRFAALVGHVDAFLSF